MQACVWGAPRHRPTGPGRLFPGFSTNRAGGEAPLAKKKTFLLRIDPKVHDALERWAADELRSVNAQIEFILREALRRAGRLKEPDEDT